MEKKLIIVKNREDLNSTICCDLMSEENFLLNNKVCDFSQTRLYRTLSGHRNSFDIREGSVAGANYIPKVY